MKTNELAKIAEDMQHAYKTKKTVGEAVEYVADRHWVETSDICLLWAMWYAIDAYVYKNK